MNKKDIKFSENCCRYIIRFTFKEEDGMFQISYFRCIDTSVHSTIDIWGAQRFFSKKEAKEVLTACNAVWPEGNGHICKVFMSAPVEEED